MNKYWIPAVRQSRNHGIWRTAAAMTMKRSVVKPGKTMSCQDPAHGRDRQGDDTFFPQPGSHLGSRSLEENWVMVFQGSDAAIFLVARSVRVRCAPWENVSPITRPRNSSDRRWEPGSVPTKTSVGLLLCEDHKLRVGS